MNRIVYVGRHALTMSVSSHLHNSWELIFYTSGSGRMVFDCGTLDYSADDVLIIPPFLPHSNHSEEGFTNIHMNLTDTTLSCTQPVRVRADANGFLRNAFQAAFYYFSAGAEQADTLLPLYGQLIVSSLTLAQPKDLHTEMVRCIENSILQNYPDCGYDLNACLDALPFSNEYLKKIFRKATGFTPHRYLLEKRLENAAGMLAICCGKGNISETARLCGFRDPLYFSRMFRKKYGVPPRSYPPETLHRPENGSDSMKIML